MGVLVGKVAVITGAGRGVGLAAATALAREGASVMLCDTGVLRDGSGGDPSIVLRAVDDLEAAGFPAAGVSSPAHTEEGAEALIQAAAARFGRVDILFNCAGVLSDATLLKSDAQTFRAPIDVDLLATFLCSRAAARLMIKQGEGGRIINTVSVSGMLGNLAQANQAAAKGGIYGLTRTAAIELQRHRITVNAIVPIAKTRQTEDLPMFEHVSTLTPEHVAPLVVYLASPAADRRTGHVLAAGGAQLYAFKVVQTAGKFKDGDEPWTADEIAEHFDAIVKG